jgi:hypothetical protein
LRDAAAWLGHYQSFWEGQIAALTDFLKEEQT